MDSKRVPQIVKAGLVPCVLTFNADVLAKAQESILKAHAGHRPTFLVSEEGGGIITRVPR
jgi:hypothetical protein